MLVIHAVRIVPARGAGQDRAAVFEHGERLVVALADGAGGTGDGARAAQAIVDAAGNATQDWSAFLDTLDGKLEAVGQSTAVVLSIDAGTVVGASCGDSGAWLIRGEDIVDLTESQVRKPLVGAGCRPVGFTCELAAGTLLVASDGLFRYAMRDDIARISRSPDLETAAHALTDLVRLANGGLQDDVAVVLCRAARSL